MDIGAIITVAGGEELAIEPGKRKRKAHPPENGSFAWCDVLGKNLVDRAISRLQDSGIVAPVVLLEREEPQDLFPSRAPSADHFLSAWEEAVSGQLSSGINTLLMMRLETYTDLDVKNLLSFHFNTGSELTQAYSQKNALEVAVINTAGLRRGKGSMRSRLSHLLPKLRRYEFSGYLNRLRNPQDFRNLAQDGLVGRAGIAPSGKEVASGIWLGDGATVDSTARIMGPTFIGARTEVKASCRISGATTIERDCKIDYGTTVSDCSVLPETYLGIGLRLNRAIAGRNRVFHLDRDVEVEISDKKLIGGNFKSHPVFSKVRGYWFSSAGASAKTFYQPTSTN